VSGTHVIVVDLEVGDGHLDVFMPLILENAGASLTNEPGCLHFDVCQSNEQPGRLLLYEVYSDANAFAAHLETDHFRRFDSATASMVVSKQVRVMTLKAD
jgi:autoinducer 2-degrading protein